MSGEWIDRWGGRLERLSRSIFVILLTGLATALVWTVLAPGSAARALGRTVALLPGYAYSLRLPLEGPTITIGLYRVSPFGGQGYIRDVLIGEGARTRSAKATAWDGRSPLLIYRQGRDTTVLRQRGRGYDTLGSEGTREDGGARRYVGMVRLESVRGRRKLTFLDPDEAKECEFDGPGSQSQLPLCDNRDPG